MKINFDKDIPVYLQLRNYFQSKVLSGELPPGASLPSIRCIANEMKVSPNTVQRTMKLLMRESFVESCKGKGYFVLKDKEQLWEKRQKNIQTIMHDFFHIMEELGFSRNEIVEMVTQRIN